MLDRLGLGWDRFFPIPGNHDIDRKIAKASWKRLREKLPRASRPEVAAWLAGGGAPLGFKDREREQVLERQAAYRHWVQDLGLADLDPASSPHGLLGYRKTLRLPGMPFDFHVLGLDSAWACGDDHDAGKLWLTDEQVMQLATEATGNALEGFRLVLVHHPLDELADGTEMRRLLADRVDLVLRGHLHEPEAQTWADPERTLRQVVAGCLYEHDRFPNACERIRITLDEQGRPLRYDLRFRGWSSRGFWFDDNSLYSETVDGRLTLWVEGRPDELPADLRVARVFVGREPELAQLTASLLQEGATRPVAICSVQGMPGVGKSYLAERFIYLYQDRFPGGVLHLVLDAESVPETAESLLGELADRLRLSPRPEGLAERVRNRLLFPRSLLHVENVDAEPLARAVARLIGLLGSCPVLLSGRYQALGETVGWVQVPVRPFDETMALSQLAEEFGDGARREEKPVYQQLVRAVGFLPLAVHLAAGYIKAGHSVEGFLTQLRQTGFTLPAADVAEPIVTRNESRMVIASTFALSLNALAAQLGLQGERLMSGLFDLGHAPAAGFGASLGSAIADLSLLDFERLAVAAQRLSLLDAIPASVRRDSAYRLHPLLAELLRARSGSDGSERAHSRVTAWFSSRLPSLPAGREEEQGKRWWEIQAETETLKLWLNELREGEGIVVERAGSVFAMLNGPFHAWLSFCERLLSGSLEENARSNVLWTLSQVARRSGDLDRAAAAAREKADLDQMRGEEREKALAMGVLADVLQARGDLEGALRIRREEQLPVYERLGDVRSRAVAMGQIADVLQARGDLEEALRIRREEQLPVYERLGDVRERAVTMGKIADMFEDRGDLEEALRIRREEQLPVYERLGDVRERTVTLGRIADVLEARGDLEESMRVRRDEELPVYERLGDVRSRAVTMTKIADILQARGDRNEALRIYREQLTVYERLGDVRLRAVTMGKIADVLQAGGDLDEALRIRREEQLPVYEHLGDVRSRAVTMGKIADVLQAGGDLDEALRIRREEELPVYERLGDVRSRAATMGQIADMLQAFGDLDEALRVRREEQLPVYERLGNVRGLLVGRAELALIHLERNGENDRESAIALLRLALAPAERLGLPEAEQIRSILRRALEGSPGAGEPA